MEMESSRFTRVFTRPEKAREAPESLSKYGTAPDLDTTLFYSKLLYIIHMFLNLFFLLISVTVVFYFY